MISIPSTPIGYILKTIDNNGVVQYYMYGGHLGWIDFDPTITDINKLYQSILIQIQLDDDANEIEDPFE